MAPVGPTPTSPARLTGSGVPKVRTEAEAAEALDIPLHTWRRKQWATFRACVTRVNVSEGRLFLYG